MVFVFLAFFAGIITVFAPCVFALLPVIVGGSMTGDVHDKRRPLIIAASLAVSLLLFTMLLKFATLFINVSPNVFTWIAGGIVVAIGLFMLFPAIYDWAIIQLNLQAKSQQLLGRGNKKGAVVGAIITGAALGPVFSSCSPVYGYILASVLPINFGAAVVYIVAYVLGLSLMLLLVGYLGQKLVRKIRWAANPRGWFTRTVALLFIVVGVLIITGLDKRFQVFIADHTALDFDKVSSQLIPKNNQAAKLPGGVLNVTPYPAPELTGVSTWINSNSLTLKSLKGKVVLIDFWTYSCINCIRTQPYLKDLYAKYHDVGFEIIGVHAPEFSFEKNPDNVRQAAKEAGLVYPIALDNDLDTWAAFNNQYWPATYLIDKDGLVRRTHFGEGEYAEEEQAVRQLLSEEGGQAPGRASVHNSERSLNPITPETYLGAARVAGYGGKDKLRYGEANYTLGVPKSTNQWTLGGVWRESQEGITAVKDAVLQYRVMASDVYLVTGNNFSGTIDVLLDGRPISETGHAGGNIKDSKLRVNMAQLYKLVHFDKYNADTTVELHVSAGVQLNTFTFGG
ncbi:MAG: redoxin family protein [Candidatus Nomurabacteria bacterium]|nr:MAG: redoxin family protein [Candidatus Nomurabacteria bacterium]